MEYFFRKHQRLFASLILGFFMFSFFASMPKRAEACLLGTLGGLGGFLGGLGRPAVPTNDIINNPKECIEDTLVYALISTLLRTFTQSIISWIHTGGFQGGSLMIESFEQHFRQVLDNEAGIFLEDIAGPDFTNLLCEPLRITIPRLAAGISGSFANRARCTITDIVDNLENFQVDFSQGSWAAWDSLLEPNNNWMGVLLGVLDEKQRREAEAFFIAQKKVDVTGGGLVPSEDCDTTSFGNIVNCVTKAPGKIVAESVRQTLDIDVDRLNLADEISEIIAAALDELVSWAITGGGGGFNSRSVKNTKKRDTVLPTASITSPQDSETVSGTITVSAGANDNKGISFVRFYVDGSEIPSDQTPPYQATIDTATLANGEHIISVVVGDNSGNINTGTVVRIIVNNAAITPPPPPPPPA